MRTATLSNLVGQLTALENRVTALESRALSSEALLSPAWRSHRFLRGFEAQVHDYRLESTYVISRRWHWRLYDLMTQRVIKLGNAKSAPMAKREATEALRHHLISLHTEE